MKNKIKTLLAKEWLIVISFVFVGIIISVVWNIGEKEYCYKTTESIDMLNEREIKVNNFLKGKIEINEYTNSEIKDFLARKNDNIKNIVNICDDNFNTHLSSVPLFDIKLEKILYNLWIAYLILLSIRIFIFITTKSIQTLLHKEV